MITSNEISASARWIRGKLGVSQLELSGLLGITAARVCQIEKGQNMTNISLKVLGRYRDLTGGVDPLTMALLLSGEIRHLPGKTAGAARYLTDAQDKRLEQCRRSLVIPSRMDKVIATN